MVNNFKVDNQISGKFNLKKKRERQLRRKFSYVLGFQSLYHVTITHAPADHWKSTGLLSSDKYKKLH